MKTYTQDEINSKFRTKKCLECSEGILVSKGTLAGGWVYLHICNSCKTEYEYQDSDMGQTLESLTSNADTNPTLRQPIYGIGDKVKIVNFGALIWENKNMVQPKLFFPIIEEDENTRWLDMCPNLVGQQGLVAKVQKVQGVPQYAIDGIQGKYAWYMEGQMEMINKNPNN